MMTIPKLVKFALFALILSPPAYGQLENIRGKDVTIVNQETGMALDVRGGVSNVGNQVWQFEQNRSKSQVFLLEQDGVDVWTIIPHVSREVRVAVPSEDTIHSNEVLSGPGNSDTPQVTKLLELASSVPNRSSAAATVTELAEINSQQNRRRWKLTAVINEPGFYFIESFANTDMLLTSIGDNPEMLEFSRNIGASSQKWMIDPLNPVPPTSLRLQSIRYKNGKVVGELFWNDESENEDFYGLFLRPPSGVAEPDPIWLESGAETFEFSFEIGDGAANERNCLVVASVREHYEDFLGTAQACGFAYTENFGPCGPWDVQVSFTDNGVAAMGGQIEGQTPDGCIVNGPQRIRIRKDNAFWPWESDTVLDSKGPDSNGDLVASYTCDPGEFVGDVYAEIRVDGDRVDRSLNANKGLGIACN